MNRGADAPMSQERPRVIVTKVRPPRRRRDLVTRERLNAYISDNLERKLLLVSAPAGYGKTSLLVDYGHASAVPVCWYRVDAGDRDPVVFFEHLVEAIRQRFPGTCARTLAVIRSQGSDGQVDVADVIGSLVNEIDEGIDEFFQLVVDDYQNIDDVAPINAGLDALLQYLPDACQLVLSGRSVPRQITLTRLAGAGEVAGIGQEQLRFSGPEIAALVKHLHGRELSEMECERLVRESEGWVMALAMGGQRLLDGVRAADVDREGLFDFLAHEVLAREPPEVQGFLLHTSILDEMTPELCDAVLERGDSAAMLDELETHNLFVTHSEGDDGRTWHRYHQLFRDFLHGRLTAGQEDVTDLHRRAAAWFGGAGRSDDEIAHLLAAGLPEAAAERMAGAVEQAHVEGRWATIVRWADALPPEILRTQPVLLMRLGTALTYGGDLDRALAAYGQALEVYEAAGDERGVAAVLVRRSVANRLAGDLQEAVSDAERSLDVAQERGGTEAGLAHRSLGGAQAQQGNLSGAVDHLTQALKWFQQDSATDLAANAHNDLSVLYQWSGRADEAIQQAEAARDTWEAVGHVGSLSLALNNLGTAHHQKGELEEARAWLTRAVTMARMSGFRRAEAIASLSLADLLADSDDLRPAQRYCMRGVELAREAHDSQLASYGEIALAETQRLLGDRAAARQSIARARELLDGRSLAFEEGFACYVEGTLAMTDGDYFTAAAKLSESVASFRALGAPRERARALMYLAANTKASGELRVAEMLLAEAESLAQSTSYPKALATTRRRVLRLMSSGDEVDASSRQGDETRTIGAEGSRSGALIVRALGRPEVVVAGRSVRRREWQSSSARGVFFFLVEQPDGATRDEIMNAFWPETEFVRARSNLHSALYRIRRAIDCRYVVQTDLDRYYVRWREGIWYDVAEVEAALYLADREDDVGRRLDILTRAASLLRGEYMSGAAEEWFLVRRRRIEQLARRVQFGLARAHEVLHQWPSAIRWYREVLDVEPAEEDAHQGLMRVLRESGERARAMRQFNECVEALQRELGVHPSPDTLALYESLAAGPPLTE